MNFNIYVHSRYAQVMKEMTRFFYCGSYYQPKRSQKIKNKRRMAKIK